MKYDVVKRKGKNLKPLAVGDRVMVMNKTSHHVGQRGTVKQVLSWNHYSVYLDGMVRFPQGLNYHRRELLLIKKKTT